MPSPNSSDGSVLEALMYASWLQAEPLRVNRYAAPAWDALLSASAPLMPVAALSSRRAPTRTMSPHAAMRRPKTSPFSVLEAFR